MCLLGPLPFHLPTLEPLHSDPFNPASFLLPCIFGLCPLPPIIPLQHAVHGQEGNGGVLQHVLPSLGLFRGEAHVAHLPGGLFAEPDVTDVGQVPFPLPTTHSLVEALK